MATPKSARTETTRELAGTADHGHGPSSRPHLHGLTLPQQILDLDFVGARSDIVGRLIAGMRGRTPSPWLVIVIRFSDDLASIGPVIHASDPVWKYKRVFAGEGRGTLNLVDYFADMSHGLLDLSKTTISSAHTTCPGHGQITLANRTASSSGRRPIEFDLKSDRCLKTACHYWQGL